MAPVAAAGARGGGAAGPSERRLIRVEGCPAEYVIVDVEESDAEALAEAGRLIRAMVAGLAELDVDVGSFQALDKELASIGEKYGASVGGALLLCVPAPAGGGRVSVEGAVGMVAIRRDREGVAEVKRLYVDGSTRGKGLGRVLTLAISRKAQQMGYLRLVLDCLERLPHALRQYAELGFERIESYVFNPMPDAVYMGCDLPLPVDGGASAGAEAAT